MIGRIFYSTRPRILMNLPFSSRKYFEQLFITGVGCKICKSDGEICKLCSSETLFCKNGLISAFEPISTFYFITTAGCLSAAMSHRDRRSRCGNLSRVNARSRPMFRCELSTEHKQNTSKTRYTCSHTATRMYWKKLAEVANDCNPRVIEHRKLTSAKTVAVEVSLEVAFVNFSASNCFAQAKRKITCFRWCGALEGCHLIDSAAAATSLIRRNNHVYRWTIAQRDACFPEAINAFLPSVVIGNQMSEARCLKLVAQFSSPSSAWKQLNSMFG